MQQYVNAPYMKFLMVPEDLVLEDVPLPPTEVTVSAEMKRKVAQNMISQVKLDKKSVERIPSVGAEVDGIYSMSAGVVSDESELEEDMISEGGKSKGRKDRYKDSEKNGSDLQIYANAVQANTVQKDLRVEYEIQSKFSLASDGIDQRVSIASYELPSSYEYHTVPKIDPDVYLVAQVSGWEKLNLLSGESNIYFNGTFIGKSFIDVNSTKDTLSFSMGKDSKVQILRTKITEKSKSKAIGSRQKFEVAWEIKVKNNGAAEIPLKIKDQFPVSVNDHIKVKRGTYSPGKLDEKTGIITWESTVGKNQSVTFNFDYLVDYRAGMLIFLE